MLRIVRLFCSCMVLSFIAIAASQDVSLAQIAPGVQQAAGQTATITGTVTTHTGAFVSGADVKLIGPAVLSTTTDAHGEFQFTSVPHGVYTIVVSAGDLGTASKPNIAVSTDVNVQIQYAAGSTSLRTIADVTTKNAGAHINVTAASIASVAPQQYAFQGNTSWTQMLEQIPGVAVNGMSVSGAWTPIVGGPLAPIQIGINGALPYETSTTIDGMPVYNVSIQTWQFNQGSVDLSEFAMDTFDSADVVRGPGANSPSVVDSIGGSFILHAPGAFTNNRYEISLSNDAYGGISADSLFQFKLSRKLSAAFTFSVWDSPGPLGRNARVLVNPYTYISTVNGQPFYGCPNSPSPYGPYCYWYNQPAYGAFASTPHNAQCSDKYQGCTDYLDSLLMCCAPVDTSWNRHTYSLALNYKISPAFNLQYFYSGYSYSDPGGVLQAGYYTEYFSPFAPGYSGPLHVGEHLISNEGGNQQMAAQSSWLGEERLTGFLGRGILRVSALQNYSWNHYIGNGYEPNGNYQLYGTAQLCTDPTCTAGGPVQIYNGSTEALTFSPSYSEYYNFWSQSRALLTSYGTQIGPRVSVGGSFVYSYNNQPFIFDYLYFNGVNDCPLEPSFCNGQDPSVAETTREMRLTAHDDISDKLSLDLSYYWAKGIFHTYACPGNFGPYYFSTPCNQYQDFAFPYRAPRFSATWRASNDIAIRGSVGGAFALPQAQYIDGGGNTGGIPYCPGQGYCYYTLPNFNLQPEKSFTWDVGTDFRIHRDSTVSLDVYRTNLYGQFYNRYSNAGFYNGNVLYTFETLNLVPTRYEGVNLSFTHDPGARGVYYSGGLGLTRSYVVSLPSGFYNAVPGQNCTAATLYYCGALDLIPGQNFSGGNYETNGAQPYANGYATIGYRWNPQDYLSLTPTYYGPGNDYYVPAFVEWNAMASYGITKNVTLLATFRNVLGIHDGSIVCDNCTTGELGAPAALGPAFYTVPNPWGPRTLILTLNFRR